jgi:hypothetical protein
VPTSAPSQLTQTLLLTLFQVPILFPLLDRQLLQLARLLLGKRFATDAHANSNPMLSRCRPCSRCRNISCGSLRGCWYSLACIMSS